MKNKIIKILLINLIIVLIFSTTNLAKYNYTYTLNAYSLTRDNSEILYEIVKTESDKEYTNQDVLLTINLNKPVYEIDGFNISEDRKTLSKLISENESNTIMVEDISGNTKVIDYDINNIDKVPPEILGVEDGKVYNSDVNIDYKDNIGINNIIVDKYSSLKISLHDDYYDTSFFKGTDLTDTAANIRVISHPKNTKSYKYYINNVFKAQSEETQYKFTGLSKGTSYTIKVEAIDGDGNVLETVTRNIKTKMFSSIVAEKNSSGTFRVTLYGIDSSIDNVVAVGYTNGNNQKASYPSINSNRSVTVNFSAQEITGTLQSGYYYFHLQLYDNDKGGVVDTACCNIIFNQTYTETTTTTLNPYNLTSNGNYQIIVTDLAGNKTTKSITISK